MLSTTSSYDTAVKASPRRWIPRVEITWTDPFIDSTVVASASNINRIDRSAQAANGRNLSTRKWAHLSTDLVADGTFYPMPDDIYGDEMGYFSATACDGSAEWNPLFAPRLTVEFAARPVLGLSVYGDNQYNEYPVDFSISIYGNGVDALLYSVDILGNDSVSWNQSIENEHIIAAERMVLSITKWSSPDRVAKITEFYTAIVEEYTGSDIVSMSLLEEREIADGSLPVGNISANELDLELQNITQVQAGDNVPDPFSYENSASFLKNVLKKNRRIRAWVGLELPDNSVEYLPLGVFWSGDWQVSERSAIVSTSARDRMESLRKAEYSTSAILENTTLYALASAVLAAAVSDIPAPDLVYEIDPELLEYSVPYGYFPRQSYFKCLQQIAGACMGQAYMTRGDVLKITGPSFQGNT